MNYANYKIFLDMHDISTQTSLAAKQGDTGRRIIVTLTERGVPFTIGENCTAVFTAKKPDGNIVFNNCTIENNIICYTFTPQTTAVAGKLDCEMRLYDADNFLITSPRFNIIVAAAVYNDGDEIESRSEVTTLTALISDAIELMDSVNSKLENGDFIPKLRMGEVATLPPGSEAKASFSGAPTAPILNLSIPQGPQGIQGIQGVQGPKGDTGEAGIIVPVVGFYTLSVDENGDLWVNTTDEENVQFEYNSETGDLYYVTEE